MIATPEVTTVNVDPGLEFVILATDGLWDVVEDQVGAIPTAIPTEDKMEPGLRRFTTRELRKTPRKQLQILPAPLPIRNPWGHGCLASLVPSLMERHLEEAFRSWWIRFFSSIVVRAISDNGCDDTTVWNTSCPIENSSIRPNTDAAERRAGSKADGGSTAPCRMTSPEATDPRPRGGGGMLLSDPLEDRMQGVPLVGPGHEDGAGVPDGIRPRYTPSRLP